MSVLVCGSMAYDTIMVFRDQFKRHILAEQLHILNVSFLVPEMRREFGGCAGNIAYSLALLGGAPRILATVGDDAGPYRDRLSKLGIDQSFVRNIEGAYTAQAFITTDLDDNQITAFHPGAMSQSHFTHVRDAAQGVHLGIVAPDGREGMLQHVRQFGELGIRFVFDPGQALPILTGDDLLGCLDKAAWCTVNDYEVKLVMDKTGLSAEQLAERLDALVVTLGAQGSRIYTRGQVFEVPCVAAEAIVDPTGCGDAYRGGLLYGLDQGWDVVRAAKLASVMGAFKIAHRGGQNYAPTREAIAKCFADSFGETF